jgi:DNA-binding NtrC family response regulator
MIDRTTGAMQKVGISLDPSRSAEGRSAGLVLLHASEYAELPGAWPLPGPNVVVGRDPDSDLFLPVQAVSRVHAEIVWEAGHFSIRDRGSRNGIMVDGHPVTHSVLDAATELRIGDALLKFVDADIEQYVPYRLDGAMLAGASRCTPTTELVGGMQMDRIAAELERIAPTMLSVMLLGESGTGKEVASRELHKKSGRSGPFQAINCAAIPATLLESELFGYRRGAFSGADRDKPGLIRLADEGTLLLDEIGDMPLEAQAKLLRVLQSREVFPLGATAPERVDVRIICATHRDLRRLIQAGRFREDLYARLNEYPLRLPPLRDRKEDLFLLTRAFLARHGRPDLVASYGFMLGLIHYDWPYNVRELEACIKRTIALADGAVATEELLPETVRQAMAEYGQISTDEDAVPSVREPLLCDRGSSRSIPSDAELRSLLERHEGNVAAVGRELGKARMQIHRWMQRYGIEVDDYR